MSVIEGKVDVVGVQLEIIRVETLEGGVRGERSGGGFVEEESADTELERDVSGGSDEGVPCGRRREEGGEVNVGGVTEPGSPHAARVELSC